MTAPLGPLTLVKEGGEVRLTGTARLQAQALDVAVAPPAPPQGTAPSPSRVAAKSAALTLTDVKATQAGGGLRLDAGIGSELAGITALWPAPLSPPPPPGRGRAAASSPAEGQLALDTLRLGPTPVRVAVAGGKTTVAGDFTTELAGLAATVPADPQQAPWKVALTKLRLALSGIDSEIAPRPPATTGTAKLELSASGVAAEQAGATHCARAPANNRTRYAVKACASHRVFGCACYPTGSAVTGDAGAQVEAIAAELPRTDRNPAAVAGIPERARADFRDHR